MNLNNEEIRIIAVSHPAVWASDNYLRVRCLNIIPKRYAVLGYVHTRTGHSVVPFNKNFYVLGALSVFLEFKTALVYPTFLSFFAQDNPPEKGTENLGIFRFWKDMGYAVGAIISGITAD